MTEERSLILEREINVVKSLEGESFYDSSIPNALKKAQTHIKNGGFVASMPNILAWRAKDQDSDAWAPWYTTFSEENVGMASQKKSVVIAVHGGGILSTPERIQNAYKEGLTEQGAARFTKKEFDDLLEGKLPNGNKISIYSFNDFKKGINHLPMQYAVVLDFDTARKSKSGEDLKIDSLRDNPLFAVRAGGVEQANAFLDMAKKVYTDSRITNNHRFKEIDPTQPQGRLLMISPNITDVYHLKTKGHFVAITSEALKRKNNTRKIPGIEKTIDILLAGSEDLIAGANESKIRENLREGLRIIYK
jgi:hypothetical protein